MYLLSGLRVCLWLGVIRRFMLSGPGSGYCVGILLIGLARLTAFIGCWLLFQLVSRAMVLFICCWIVLQKLVLFGMLILVVGLDWVCLLFILLPVLGRFSRIPFYRVGEILFFADLCKREGFRGIQGVAPLLDWDGSLKLLLSSHVRERDKALLRAILVGGVWNGFLLGRMRGEEVPCRFCGGRDGDGHLFWECSFSPLFAA